MSDEFKCPICWAKKPDSPIIHYYSIMKKYSKRSVLAHIKAKHTNTRDQKLVDDWEKDGEKLEIWSPP